MTFEFDVPDVDKREMSRNELQIAIAPLVEIPRYLASNRKRERKWARERLPTHIKNLQKISNEYDWFIEDEYDPAFVLKGYHDLLDKGDFNGASNFAREWICAIRNNRAFYNYYQQY